MKWPLDSRNLLRKIHIFVRAQTIYDILSMIVHAEVCKAKCFECPSALS